MTRSWCVYTRDHQHPRGTAQGAAPRVVLDNVRSAFNVGSVFRTCEAAGVSHLHLCGICAYPPNPRVLKTALGAERMVPWTHSLSTIEAIEGLQANGCAIIAVELTDCSRPFHEVRYSGQTAFVFGHEVSGVAIPILDRADMVVEIPMMGRKNSLNIATSVGIILFDHLTRRLAPDRPGH